MIRVHCDICLEEILENAVNIGTRHFCSGCVAQAEDFITGANEIFTKGLLELNARIENYRNRFMQQKILPARKRVLAAVK